MCVSRTGVRAGTKRSVAKRSDVTGSDGMGWDAKRWDCEPTNDGRELGRCVYSTRRVQERHCSGAYYRWCRQAGSCEENLGRAWHSITERKGAHQADNHIRHKVHISTCDRSRLEAPYSPRICAQVTSTAPDTLCACCLCFEDSEEPILVVRKVGFDFAWFGFESGR